jgi:hypothetical protein
VGAGTVAALPSLPSLPAPPDLSSYSAWQTFGTSLGGIGDWVTAHPILTVVCVAWAGGMAYLPKIWEALQWRLLSRF